MLILKPLVVPPPPPPPPLAGARTKAALTLFSPLMLKVQVNCAPAQSPVQPLKVELLAGLAVRVTAVPRASCAVQELPQLILVPVTVPDPVPVLVTVMEDTPTLAAAIWLPMKSPSSPSRGWVQRPSPPQRTWPVAGSSGPEYL